MMCAGLSKTAAVLKPGKKKIHNLEKRFNIYIHRFTPNYKFKRERNRVLTLSERRDVFFSVSTSVVLAGCFDFTT